MTESHDPGKEWRQERGIPIVASFDAYRALAVIGVVLFHIFEVCGVVAKAGDSLGGILIWGILPRSIIVFFVVSGFVMYLPTAVRGGDFGRVSSFAIGRVARIIPAYWLALVVALILLVALSTPPPAWSVLAHFTMFQTPALLIDGPVAVNGSQVGSFALGFGVVPPVWTMSVETAFYLVLPLVAVPFFRRPFLGLAAAAGFLTLWQVGSLHAGDVASFFGIGLSAATEARFTDFYASLFPSWAFALACGMTIAWLYVWLRDRIPARLLEQRALWAVLASAPAVAVVIYLTGLDAARDPNALNGLFARQPLLLSFAYPLATASAMLAFSLAPIRVQRPLANQPMRGLADISYSVYLIHFAVIWFALEEFAIPTTGSLWSAVAWSALVFPVSIVYAWLSANLLERPIRRWANKYRRRGSAPRPGAEAPAAAPFTGGSGSGALRVGGEAPPVSIVLSTYNRPEWLRGAIDSVLAQDYPNLELLVVDDGSAGETPQLLEEYARRHPEDRFRFIRQENAGQARALNHGNEVARGEILGYLSDDDLLAPGAVSRLAGELIADPAAAVAYPAYLTIDQAGVEIDTVLPIEYSPLAALRLHDTIIGPGALTRRWALESAGGWDPELRFMGDLILWMGVGLAGRAIRVPEPLASWRRHPGSATVQRNAGRAREHLAIVGRGQATEGFPPLSRADYAETIRNACLFASLMCGDKEEWPERFAMFDLHPKRISAFGSGYGAGARIDWADVAENARLYRELVLLTARRAKARAKAAQDGDRAATGGADLAVARLREVGALSGEDGSFAEGVGEWDLRLGLLEAALACGAEVDPQSMRFLLLDRDRVSLSETEQSRVVRLGYCCTVEELREALAELTSDASAAAPEGSS